MVTSSKKFLSHKSSLFRPAFTMIELIFAIVIISISMLSLPLIITGDATSQEDSFMQEGIMITSTKVSQVLTYQWDPNSPPPLAGITTASEVVATAAGDPALEQRNGNYRIGHIQEKLRRRTGPRNASAIGAGGNSISSYVGGAVNVVNPAGSQTGYKKQWQITTVVSYVSDIAAYGGNAINYNFPSVPTGGPTNIKMVQVTALDQTPGASADQVVLTSYSSNIGEAEFYKRRY